MIAHERLVGAKVDVSEQRTKKEERSKFRIQQIRVFPEPPESGALCEIPLEDRSRIDIRAMTRPDLPVQPFPKLVELVPHHTMIVVTARVAGDGAIRRRAAIIHRDDKRRAHPRLGQRWIVTNIGVLLEVRHLAGETTREPRIELGGRFGRAECRDAREIESKIVGVGLES
jgi:hypothetical protein